MPTFRRSSRTAGEHAPSSSTFTPTPIYITPRIRLVLIVATFVVLYLLAAAAPSIPRLLVLGATVALVLSFPVRMLSQWVARKWAIAIAVSSTLFFAIVLLVLLIPFIISEVSEFVQALPTLAEDTQSLARDLIVEMNQRGWIRQDPDEVLENVQSNLISRAQTFVEVALGNLMEGLTRSINILISTFGVIFIATYLLVDMPRFRQTFVNSFAGSYRRDAEQLWITLGDSLSRYLGGLLVSITLQGILAAVGLWLIGVPYAFILGIWMTLTAVLPYIGAFLGAIPSVIIALTISWQATLATVLLYVVINQVESNFITPRIQGEAVRVHPLLIFISVLLGSELGGAFGAIIAVPTLAVIRVLAEFFWVRLRVRGPHQDMLLSAIGGDAAPEPGPLLSVEPEGEPTDRPLGPELDRATAQDPSSSEGDSPESSDPTRGTANRDTTGR